jgi:hypothetical protein
MSLNADATGDAAADDVIKLDVELFVAGDKACFGTTLGKEGMAGAWCIYCPLSKNDWQPKDHTIPDPWTIQSLIDMALDDKKKGTDKCGVKSNPVGILLILETGLNPAPMTRLVWIMISLQHFRIAWSGILQYYRTMKTTSE